MTTNDRPMVCPTCGDRIGMLAPVVRLGKGPWTCEVCGGRTAEKIAAEKERRERK